MMDERRLRTLMLACGVVGPVLFVIVFLVEGATRPGYSAWRNYVSQLSTGETGWVQIANFLVCGPLTLAFSVALWRAWPPRFSRGVTWGPTLLVVYSLALILAGIFSTDPALGYPPGTSSNAHPQTLHGNIHGVAGLLAFGTLAAAGFVFARRFAGEPNWKGWPPYSLITGLVVALGFIAATATSVLDERGIMPNAPTGLIQRIAIIAGWAWVAILAYRLLREPRLLGESARPISSQGYKEEGFGQA